MIRRNRRMRSAVRLERLETRALLSVVQLETSAALPPADHELLVRFADRGASGPARAMIEGLGASVARSYQSGSVLLSLPADESLDAALASLKANPDVVYAQVNHTIRVLGANDPDY